MTYFGYKKVRSTLRFKLLQLKSGVCMCAHSVRFQGTLAHKLVRFLSAASNRSVQHLSSLLLDIHLATFAAVKLHTPPISLSGDLSVCVCL